MTNANVGDMHDIVLNATCRVPNDSDPVNALNDDTDGDVSNTAFNCSVKEERPFQMV